MPRKYQPYRRASTTKDGIPGYNTPHAFVETEEWTEYRRRRRIQVSHHRQVRLNATKPDGTTPLFSDVSHIPYPLENQER